MTRTFYSFTFGCRVNEAEKIALDRKLLELGFVWRKKNPDFYVINSCAVTGKAEREVRQHIYQTRKKFPETTIIVTGCAATNWTKNTISIKGVNLLIPNNSKQPIPLVIQQMLPKTGDLTSSPQYHRVNMLTRCHDKFLASGRLMVKIQDGCDRYCSYCIVPYLRSKPKSRTIKEIIQTINEFHLSSRVPQSGTRRSLRYSKDYFAHARNDNGISEVILTAINTECFGKDTGETLIDLIDAIIKQTTIPKISFGSIHPWNITDEFLAYYQSIIPTNRFIPFFHIPIQSGSNTVLQLMNRGYAKEDIFKKLEKIKSINPIAFIGTDIIVGFPGETNKEFQETYDFLKKAPIDKIHVFRFSPRPGTAAEKLKKTYGESTPQEKRERAKILLGISKKKSKKFPARLSQ